VKVAVTGGTGVVGSAVVRHLVAAGHEVAALARSEDSAIVLRAAGCRALIGDVLDVDALGALFSDAELVFHIAGVNEMCSRDPGQMDRVNIDGTRLVLEGSLRAGVTRLVHTSSAAAIGEAAGTIGSEESPHRGRYQSRYERSKHLSEMLVLAERGDLEVVCVNPSSVQGPGRATGTAKLILDILNGDLSFLVETSISIVDIDDTARGHLLAAEKGEPGERYLLNGASMTISDAVSHLEEATGRRLDLRFLPGPLVSAGAVVVEAGARAIGRRPPFCREMVRVLRAGHIYDGSKAQRELGLVYTPFAETLTRTVEWYEAAGLLTS
jgi:dihydroflavonol-4-reductase